MKNNNAIIYIIIGILAVAIFYMFFRSFSENRDIVYINTAEVINNFNYAKDLESKYKDIVKEKELIIEDYKAQLSNISIQNKALSDREIEDYKTLELKLQIQTEQFIRENENIINHYNSLILERLNLYVQEYGKKNNNTLILGATGNGSVMYAKDILNVTEDVIIFINSRYEGE